MKNNATQPQAHFCPAWLAFSLDNPLRRWLHKPEQVFAGLIGEGQTTIDLGCGPGVFTLPLAQMVGETGRVIAVDMQAAMLEKVRQRAAGTVLLPRIELHNCSAELIGLEAQADFILAFWMVHEVIDKVAFLKQVRELLKPQGRFLMVEPILHVSAENFRRTSETAINAGLRPVETRNIRISRAILFSPG